MSVLTKELEPYKLRARRHRGRMLKALETGDQTAADAEFEDAKSAIAEGFAKLGQYEPPDPTAPGVAGEGETALAEQLADLWGIQGGLYRSRGGNARDASGETDLDHAIEAYDNGWRYESSGRFRILNSYNTVNRLVLRILRSPALLDSADPVPGLGKSMSDLLGDAADLIERQIETGREDVPWALADLAMTEILRDGNDVASILDQLDESTLTDPYPLQSMLNVIRDLLRAGVKPGDGLIAAGERIRSRLPEAMKGSAVLA